MCMDKRPAPKLRRINVMYPLYTAVCGAFNFSGTHLGVETNPFEICSVFNYKLNSVSPCLMSFLKSLQD